MSIHPDHLRRLIIHTLIPLDPLYSDDALELGLGTFAVESDFGTFLRQRSGGPALGIGSMEGPTFNWLQQTYCGRFPEIADWRFEELEWDLRKAIVMTRLKYWSIPVPLPPGNNVQAMAEYWDRYYNCNPDKGRPKEFVAKYNRYVKGVHHVEHASK